MTSVWKRLQRVGKRASKFQFVASFEELIIESTKKWQPDKLRVMWIRRNRRHTTKLHCWQPGIKNPYRGLVVWQVPESLNITVTLFKDPTAEEFEDKDWTFVIENETNGRRKVLASADVNMKKYASSTPAQYDITLKLKPLSVKVVEATLRLNLSCIFLKEGKATDEDMQSLASLMSMKQSDIGNLDDFNDSDDEDGEERRVSFGTGQTTHATEFRSHLDTLCEEDNMSAGPASFDSRVSASQKAMDADGKTATTGAGETDASRGNVHCRMWHSIPDMPLLLTISESSVRQTLTREGSTVATETERNKVTEDSRGFLSSETPSNSFTLDSLYCHGPGQAHGGESG
ncbi:EH domain-binding protein 1 [Nematolebias whitei]|uniref:EH domain-binding protein 1 n=1 Tax=Nematolebias whitei TaxID=451745 RepID=UPI00189B1A31|nr:EH domain-binding protein 1 [Nematolebias whitei]